MSKLRLQPANDHVLVVDNPRESVIGDILMPENVRQQEMVFGKVLEVGPRAVSTKRLDRVCYGPYAGKSILLNGTELRLLREGQIESYIREEGEEEPLPF